MATVDLDLLIKAMSQGRTDAMKIPTPFSAFMGGLIGGFDDELKAERQRNAIEIEDNQIEMQPVANQIQRNTADRGTAELAEYRADPEAYVQRQQEIAEYQDMKRERDTQLMIRQQQFQDILQSGDPKRIGQEVMSGQWSDVLTPDKRQDIAAQTITQWDPKDQESFFALKSMERRQAEQTRISETVGAKLSVAQEPFYANSRIQSWAQQAEMDPVDLLEQGEIVTIRSNLIPKTEMKPALDPTTGQPILGEDKKPIMRAEPVYENGTQVMVPDPNNTDAGKPHKVFRLKDGRILDYDVDNDTEKDFVGYQTPWNYTHRMGPKMGGDRDLRKNVDQTRLQEQARQVAQAAEDSLNPADIQAAEDRFWNRTKFQPQVQSAAADVRSGSQARLDAMRSPPAQQAAPEPSATPRNAQAQGTPGPAMTPTLAPRRGDEPPRVMTPAAPAPVATPQAVAPPMMTPAATPTVGATASGPQSAPAPMTPTAAPEQTPAATVNAAPTAATPRPRQHQALIAEMLKNKGVRAQENKEAPPAQREAARGVSLVPEAEAAAQSAPSSDDLRIVRNVPAMKVNSPERLNVEAIRRVATRPDLATLGALEKALIVAESAGIEDAVSNTQVKGIAQVTGKTFNGIIQNGDLTDPMNSSRAGAVHLTSIMARRPTWRDNPMLALTAYNVGELAVGEAVRLAGTTDWQKVKMMIPAALQVPRVAERLRADGVRDLDKKAKEAQMYAERVAMSFPAFVRTTEDMKIAEKLKRQGVLVY